MNCQRCAQNQGEYICSVCNRIVCSSCNNTNNGRIYCLDHSPLKQAQGQTQSQPKPQHKTLMDIIYADLILLIGISIIFFFTNNVISGMLESNRDIISQNFPQLSFVFVLVTYFSSFGLYAIITLFIILIASISVLIMKKRQDKNI